MSQANIAYSTPASDAAGFQLALSIFADRAHLREVMRDDAQAAGFHVREASSLSVILEGGARMLGDVVLLDCPQVDGASLAALARLDMRAANCGARLIVSTTVEALDDVFACMDQSQPQLLIDPSRAERVIALGRALASAPGSRVRELSEEDRLTLLRLTEQVGQIATQLERLYPASEDTAESAFRFASPKRGFSGKEMEDGGTPPLPDPRQVRRIIRQRQLRGRFFDGDLFADPAWDMLLDLTAARAEGTRVSVTSLCIASGVPPTTALRWIGQMTQAGLLERIEDDTDRRRAFIALSDKAADAMARLFAQLGSGAGKML